MTEKGNMAKLLKHLDGDGYAELLVVIQEQLCAQIDSWFAKYEAGDEHGDGSSNVLAVEMAGTPEDPYIFVGQGMYVTELTRQGPYQAEIAPSSFKMTPQLATICLRSSTWSRCCSALRRKVPRGVSGKP